MSTTNTTVPELSDDQIRLMENTFWSGDGFDFIGFARAAIAAITPDRQLHAPVETAPALSEASQLSKRLMELALIMDDCGLLKSTSGDAQRVMREAATALSEGLNAVKNLDGIRLHTDGTLHKALSAAGEQRPAALSELSDSQLLEIQCQVLPWDQGTLFEFARAVIKADRENRPVTLSEVAPWKLTKGGAYESGEYSLTERIDGKGWNATALIGGEDIHILLGGTLLEVQQAAEKHRNATRERAITGEPVAGESQRQYLDRISTEHATPATLEVAEPHVAKTAPASHELSDARINELWESTDTGDSILTFARAVLKASGETK